MSENNQNQYPWLTIPQLNNRKQEYVPPPNIQQIPRQNPTYPRQIPTYPSYTTYIPQQKSPNKTKYVATKPKKKRNTKIEAIRSVLKDISPDYCYSKSSDPSALAADLSMRIGQIIQIINHMK